MKKILGTLFWIVAMIGVLGISLTTWILDNYVMFYVCVFMLIVGIIGILFTSKKSREYIYSLLDLI